MARKTISTNTTPAAAKAAANPLDELLGVLNAAPEKTVSPTKTKKNLVVLDGKAADLLEIQNLKNQKKSAEARIAQLEAEIFPLIEANRLAINIARQEYVGSINVQATGTDADGKPIEAPVLSYYIQNRYSAFNPFGISGDGDLQAAKEGKATLKDEAVAVVAAKAGVSEKKAEEMLKERMDVEHTISLSPGALQKPEVLKVLREHLSQYLVSSSSMTPNARFHEQSNYVQSEMALMEALSEIGLVKRSKGVIR